MNFLERVIIRKGIWDGVVDTVGGEALTKILLKLILVNSAQCGNAGGIKISTNVMPF